MTVSEIQNKTMHLSSKSISKTRAGLGFASRRKSRARAKGIRGSLIALIALIACGAMLAPVVSGTLYAKPKAEPEFLHVKNAAPRSRAALQFTNDELTQHKFYTRSQTLQAYGEFAFADFISIHANLPVTRRWVTDAERQTRFDNMRVGAKLGFRFDWLMPYFGLAVDLPTGDEEEGIGSKEIGNIEPHAGLRIGSGWFFWQLGARYNSESNKEFREVDLQEFRRFYLLETAIALSFQYVDLLVEYSYKRLLEEQEFPGLSASVIAPGVNIKPTKNFVIGLGVTYALSREREYDYGYQVRLTYLF
ncbi:MAG: hypothetical protein NXI24_23560 [bacterium]|nr:hypothetical protein [bacterium]